MVPIVIMKQMDFSTAPIKLLSMSDEQIKKDKKGQIIIPSRYIILLSDEDGKPSTTLPVGV